MSQTPFGTTAARRHANGFHPEKTASFLFLRPDFSRNYRTLESVFVCVSVLISSGYGSFCVCGPDVALSQNPPRRTPSLQAFEDSQQVLHRIFIFFSHAKYQFLSDLRRTWKTLRAGASWICLTICFLIVSWPPVDRSLDVGDNSYPDPYQLRQNQQRAFCENLVIFCTLMYGCMPK